MNKKSLQIATLVLGFIPVASGLLGMMGIHDPLYADMGIPGNATLDSNLRFLSGVWTMMGLAAWWTVPAIERRGDVFKLIWGAIFLGGVGRLMSMAVVGIPPMPFIGFTVLEVVGAPFFILWQHRLAKAVAAPNSVEHDG